jgi:hypothetical protein
LRKPNRIRTTLPAARYHQGRAFHEVRTAVSPCGSPPKILARPGNAGPNRG